MREVLFRGKCLHNAEWFEGESLLKCNEHTTIAKAVTIKVDEYCILSAIYNSAFHGVYPETVGRYTGLTDKNGKKIFEGDIVKNDWCFACGYSVIKFGQYKSLDMSNEYQQGHLGFYLEHIHKADKRSVRKDILFFANKCEIIGNIHDNPELLKEGEQK